MMKDLWETTRDSVIETVRRREKEGKEGGGLEENIRDDAHRVYLLTIGHFPVIPEVSVSSLTFTLSLARSLEVLKLDTFFRDIARRKIKWEGGRDKETHSREAVLGAESRSESVREWEKLARRKKVPETPSDVQTISVM